MPCAFGRSVHSFILEEPNRWKEAAAALEISDIDRVHDVASLCDRGWGTNHANHGEEPRGVLRFVRGVDASMDRDALIEHIVRSTEAPVTPQQIDFLLQLASIYAHRGVLRDRLIPSLVRCCEMAMECWRDVSEERRPRGVSGRDPASENGCMILPWVGPEYMRGGVCVLGMNIHYGGGDAELGIEYRIALDPKWGQLPNLRKGRQPHRSKWAKCTMQDVAAVLRAARGLPPETTDPSELADALLRSSRVQVVKCSPIGERSTPLPNMVRNCPSQFMLRELDVLQPSVLLAYGQPVKEALRGAGGWTVEESEPTFQRGTMKLRPGTTVLVLTHPAHGRGGWTVAHRALLRSLEERPVPCPASQGSQGEIDD